MSQFRGTNNLQFILLLGSPFILILIFVCNTKNSVSSNRLSNCSEKLYILNVSDFIGNKVMYITINTYSNVWCVDNNPNIQYI